MKEIPPERRALYYLGMVIAGTGLILFLSVFFSNTEFGDFRRFEEKTRVLAMRAVIGVVLIGVGAVIRGLGAQGAAGSGLVIDPKKAKDDLEPWARMEGGLMKDALDEAGIKPAAAPMSFDEKLRRLEALRKDGLISEIEHQAKRKEILDEKL